MNAPETMTMNCPSEETLAAFIDGRLDGDARQRVVQHVTACGECRDVLVGVQEMGDSNVDRLNDNVVPLSSRSKFYPRLTAAAAGIVLLFLGAYVWQRFSQPSAVDTLVEATETLEERPMLARVAMPLAWRPPARTMRSGEVPDHDLAVLIATQRIAEIVNRNQSTENIRALAAANLLRRQPDEAVSALEAVLLQQTEETDVARAIAKSRDAALLVDLSAAYLTRVRRSDTSRDAALAGESASRAWSLEKTPAAAWNRALALEELKLEDEAIGAWQEYLNIDPTSEWATEARDRMTQIAKRPMAAWEHDRRNLDSPVLSRAIVTPLARAYPRQVATYAENLFVQWSLAQDNSAASLLLTRIELIGEALAVETGDRFVLDCAQSINAARSASGVGRIKSGLNKLAEGRDATDLTEAASQFAAAEVALEASPLVYLAVLERARNAFARNDFAAASTAALRAGDEGAPVRYPSIIVRRGWLAGVCLVETGQPHAALAEYTSALEAAEVMRDTDAAAALHALIAQDLSLLGRIPEAWQHRASGFELARRSTNPQRLGYVIAEANVAAVDEDLHEMSALFTRVATVDSHASRPIVVGSMMWGARRLHSMGRSDDAVAEISRARALLGGIDLPEARERSAALIDLTEGAILSDREPRRSLELLNKAVAFFERTNENVEIAQAFEARARSHDALSDDSSAAADVLRALSAIERQRDSVTDAVLRASYVETRGRLFERMVRTALNHHDIEGAFVLADRSHVGFFLDDSTTRLTAARIQGALAPDALLLEYYSLDDRLLVWIVSSERIEQRTIAIPRNRLAAAIREMNAAVGDDDLERFNTSAAELHELLFHPIADLIERARLLVIVPDPRMDTIAFSALYDGRSKRRVFQDYDVVLTPSATAYQRLTLGLRRAPRDRLPRVAIFANAEIKGDLFPALERLEWAEAEARDAHGRMQGSDVFIGATATRESFLNAMQSYDAVHFAGHAVLHVREPDLSALLLSDVNGEADPFYSREMRSIRTWGVSVVVLSACDTATVGRLQRNGGRSLAESFLAAGVPTVIGSLFPVEDGGAAALMAAFYTSLARGVPYAAALRSAKIEVAAQSAPGPSRDLAWLAYEVIGTSDG